MRNAKNEKNSRRGDEEIINKKSEIWRRKSNKWTCANIQHEIQNHKSKNRVQSGLLIT